MAPPPIIRSRETQLGSSPSPPSADWLPTDAGVHPPPQPGSPPARTPAALTSASAAPTLVGVAETAPPWYVSLTESLELVSPHQ